MGLLLILALFAKKEHCQAQQACHEYERNQHQLTVVTGGRNDTPTGNAEGALFRLAVMEHKLNGMLAGGKLLKVACLQCDDRAAFLVGIVTGADHLVIDPQFLELSCWAVCSEGHSLVAALFPPAAISLDDLISCKCLEEPLQLILIALLHQRFLMGRSESLPFCILMYPVYSTIS